MSQKQRQWQQDQNAYKTRTVLSERIQCLAQGHFSWADACPRVKGQGSSPAKTHFYQNCSSTNPYEQVVFHTLSKDIKVTEVKRNNAARLCCLKASLLSLYLKKMITGQTRRSAVSYFPWRPLFAPVQALVCVHTHTQRGREKHAEW